MGLPSKRLPGSTWLVVTPSYSTWFTHAMYMADRATAYISTDYKVLVDESHLLIWQSSAHMSPIVYIHKDWIDEKA